MKKLFSLVLGGFLLIGAATLGLQSGTASAAAPSNNHHRHHKHHRHHRHHHRKNQLSY